MKVYDCFIFSNEIELLEIRLNELDDVVDYFVIIESNLTFTNSVKEYNFELNKVKFKNFLHKIIYYKIDDYLRDYSNLEIIKDPKSTYEKKINFIYEEINKCKLFDKKNQPWWGNDFFQRECIGIAIENCNIDDDDIFIISDADEIINKSVLKNQIKNDRVYFFYQNEYCHYFNYYHNPNWIGSAIIRYKYLKDKSINSVRFCAKRNENLKFEIGINGGWHFTSIGRVEAIKEKLRNWSHVEFNNILVRFSLDFNIRNGRDIFMKKGFGSLTCIQINFETSPQYLVLNQEKFHKLIGPKIINDKLIIRIFYKIIFLLNLIYIRLILKVNKI